jgi:hypothetical protein
MTSEHLADTPLDDSVIQIAEEGEENLMASIAWAAWNLPPLIVNVPEVSTVSLTQRFDLHGLLLERQAHECTRAKKSTYQQMQCKPSYLKMPMLQEIRWFVMISLGRWTGFSSHLTRTANSVALPVVHAGLDQVLLLQPCQATQQML